MNLVIKILINASALWVAVTLIDGFQFNFDDNSLLAFFAVALLLGIVNVTIKPILKVLSLPFLLLTLGIGIVLVNAVVLTLVVGVSSLLSLGLVSDSFGATLLAALVISVVSFALETLTRRPLRRW
ncbi:MAG: phage holin family protein [Nitriliruptoraceae bacterium]